MLGCDRLLRDKGGNDWHGWIEDRKSTALCSETQSLDLMILFGVKRAAGRREGLNERLDEGCGGVVDGCRRCEEEQELEEADGFVESRDGMALRLHDKSAGQCQAARRSGSHGLLLN